MRYNEFTMLPSEAFKVVAGRMTYEGGGGGKGGGTPPPPAAAPLPEPPKPFAPAGEKPDSANTSASQMVDAGRKGTKGLRIDLGSDGAASGGASGLSIPS